MASISALPRMARRLPGLSICLSTHDLLLSVPASGLSARRAMIGIHAEQQLGDVTLPYLGMPDIAKRHVVRAVTCLRHDVFQIRAGERRRGRQAGPQAVPRKPV